MSNGWHVYRPPREEPAADPAGDDRAAAPHSAEGAPSDEEAALWRRWREEQDTDARWRLVERHGPYAERIAARAFARRPHDGLEFGDFRQFAMVGLLESIDRYVPGGVAQFRTFATRRIQGAILNGLEHMDERHEQAAAWRRARRERAESLAPSHFDLGSADHLLADLGEIAIGLAFGFILEDGVLTDPTRADELHAHVELRQLRLQLWEAVRQLPGRERSIVELHYREGVRFDVIAERLDLSKGRVSQLHARAVRSLRELMCGADRCDVAF